MDTVNKNLDLGMQAWNKVRGYDQPSVLPPRPAASKLGQPAKIGLNTFNVIEYPSKPVYSYDVLVNKGDDKRGLIKSVWESQAVKQALGDDFIWDGNLLAWSTKSLDREIRLNVNLDQEKGKTPKPGKKPDVHNFHLRKTGTVRFDVLRAYLARQCDWDNSILESINFLDHLLRDGPSKRLTAIKRSFFQRGESRFDLGSGVEAFKGAYQSLRVVHGPTGPCLSINVDVANGTFFNSGPLQHLAVKITGARDPADLIQQALRGKREEEDARQRNPHSRFESRVSKGLKRLSKLRVVANHRGANIVDEYVIDKIMLKSAKEHKFMQRNEQTGKETAITVYDYFLKTYNVRIQYPDFPMVQMKRGGGSVVIPMELLRVKENQRYPFKCDERQTANMIKFAVTPPSERWKAVEHGLKMLSWNTDANLQKYGLKVTTNRTVVDARVLTAPKVQYGTGVANPGTSGRWDLKGKKFLLPNTAPLKSWCVTVLAGKRGGKPDKSSIDNFVKEFVKIYKSHGGRVENTNPAMNLGSGDDTGAIVTAAWNMAGNQSNTRPQILVFILPDKDSIIYGRIKRSAECRYGVVSQCMQFAHVQKCQGQYISNVCMKFNAKLGGTTCRSVGSTSGGPAGLFTKTPTLVIGADVSHAAPGQQSASMAAMTASMDPLGARYAAVCDSNGFRVEMIQTEKINSMLKPLIQHWVGAVGNGSFPKRILYFRDGVSEQQYSHVLQQEVADMKALLKSANPALNIPFVVVIGGKRHHIRVFPEKGDRNGNPFPGTLVESGCTQPYENDFYLCSHAALKGTARPTHYHVILNEANMSNDELQTILYEQVYQYARATTPVSIHPAIYYAHIASNRAGPHAVNWQGSTDGRGTQAGGSSGQGSQPVDVLPLMPMPNHGAINTSMWYI
jgi:eukaryotic translation initiation factor 2C